MTQDELKNLISEKTGVPAEMLTGENAEDNLERARQLLAYKRENAGQTEKDPAEQFASWFRSQTGEPEETETPEAALNEIAETIRIENGSYPIIPDGGSPYINGITAPDSRSNTELFKEWLYNETAFDPFSNDGWRPL